MKKTTVVIIVLSLLIFVACSDPYEVTPENPTNPSTPAPSTTPSTPEPSTPSPVEVHKYVVTTKEGDEVDMYMVFENYSGYIQFLFDDDDNHAIRFNHAEPYSSNLTDNSNLVGYFLPEGGDHLNPTGALFWFSVPRTHQDELNYDYHFSNPEILTNMYQFFGTNL